MDQMEQTARALWQLLDDIDTMDDAARSNDAAYREAVRKISRKRFAHASSDGYELTFLHGK